MKKQILNVFALVILICVACSVYGQSNQIVKVEKIKTGFHCPAGKALIEKALIQDNGVTSVVADLDSKIVTVTYVEGKTNRENLVRAIENVGYTTEDTKGSFNATSNKPHPNK